MNGGFVEDLAFAVAEPAPFIKIPAHINNMYPQHSQRLIRSFRVVVNNGCVWEIDREIVAMDATSEVHILRIHKETLIKESGLLNRLGTQ